MKVKASVKIFHVPKLKGADLKDERGEVVEICDTFKGVQISSTLPVVVQFTKTPEGGKPLKFTAHFIDDELEAV